MGVLSLHIRPLYLHLNLCEMGRAPYSELGLRLVPYHLRHLCPLYLLWLYCKCYVSSVIQMYFTEVPVVD